MHACCTPSFAKMTVLEPTRSCHQRQVLCKLALHIGTRSRNDIHKKKSELARCLNIFYQILSMVRYSRAATLAHVEANAKTGRLKPQL